MKPKRISGLQKIVPVAKRTRAALRSNWHQRSGFFILSKGATTFEIVASKVLYGGYHTKARDYVADIHGFSGDAAAAELFQEVSSKLLDLNFDGIRVSGQCKEWLQAHADDVIECAREMARKEVKKQVLKLLSSQMKSCKIHKEEPLALRPIGESYDQDVGSIQNPKRFSVQVKRDIVYALSADDPKQCASPNRQRSMKIVGVGSIMKCCSTTTTKELENDSAESNYLQKGSLKDEPEQLFLGYKDSEKDLDCVVRGDDEEEGADVLEEKIDTNSLDVVKQPHPFAGYVLALCADSPFQAFNQGFRKPTASIYPKRKLNRLDALFDSENSCERKGKKNANRKAKRRKTFQATRSLLEKLMFSIAEEARIPFACENALGCQTQSEDEEEEEDETEEMWKEMQLALKGHTSNLTNSGNSGNDSDSDDSLDGNVPFLCDENDHEFIVDEEIGLLCRVCRFVKQEMRSILPPLEMETRKFQGLNGYESEFKGSAYIGQIDLEEQMQESFYETHHFSGQTVWDIIPNLKQSMYTHQQQGFEFLWRNLAGSLVPEKMKAPTSENVGGCIISHAPGTGKSFLMISFLKTYLELFPRSRPLLVAPYNMLFSWEREFHKWDVELRFHILNRAKSFWAEICSMEEYSHITDFARYHGFRRRERKELSRLVMISEWYKKPSVLAVSYNLFVYLTGRGKGRTSNKANDIGQLLVESPGVLILDEGHQVRNDRSKLWRAFQNVKTKRRIILSGTVFQNNCKELFNTLYLVSPSFIQQCMGIHFPEGENLSVKDDNQRVSRKLFMEEIGHRIQNGDEEIHKTLARFRHMTSEFVHCYEGKILNCLPGLRDFAVILRPSDTQQDILNHVNQENLLRKLSNFEYETFISVVCIHPSLCNEFGYKRLSELCCREGLNQDPSQGCKAKFVLDLVELATITKEKVLLFSQNIPPLLYMGDILETKLSLCKGREVLQLDGTLPMEDRQVIIDRFNNPSDPAKVLLASIKTCSEGVSLIGASRVVFMDLVWNPSVVKQAVSRAFRLGQKQYVYVYRLVAAGTIEEEKYRKTVWKDCISRIVFSTASEAGIDETDTSCIEPQEQHPRERANCEDKLLDKLLELDRDNKAFHSIFEHTKIKNDAEAEGMEDYFYDYYIS